MAHNADADQGGQPPSDHLSKLDPYTLEGDGWPEDKDTDEAGSNKLKVDFHGRRGAVFPLREKLEQARLPRSSGQAESPCADPQQQGACTAEGVWGWMSKA